MPLPAIPYSLIQLQPRRSHRRYESLTAPGEGVAWTRDDTETEASFAGADGWEAGRVHAGVPVDRYRQDADQRGYLWNGPSDLFIRRGVPDYLCSDKEPEFTAERMSDLLPRVEVKTLFIEQGSPSENGYVESFNGKLRDELLNGEIFDTLMEAMVLIERWHVAYNTIRPLSALGYRPPAPEAEKTEELT